MCMLKMGLNEFDIFKIVLGNAVSHNIFSDYFVYENHMFGISRNIRFMIEFEQKGLEDINHNQNFSFYCNKENFEQIKKIKTCKDKFKFENYNDNFICIDFGYGQIELLKGIAVEYNDYLFKDLLQKEDKGFLTLDKNKISEHGAFLRSKINQRPEIEILGNIIDQKIIPIGYKHKSTKIAFTDAFADCVRKDEYDLSFVTHSIGIFDSKKIDLAFGEFLDDIKIQLNDNYVLGTKQYITEDIYVAVFEKIIEIYNTKKL